ncbi:MAG: PIG-L family deacetylase [Anaerolineales bacterium]
MGYNRFMRWIYLSPHLDDAALSAGGLIHDQAKAGMPVEIWTFMCGVPADTELSLFAQVLHYQWGFASARETVLSRREEDRQAAGILGAQVQHFDFLDCIYRRGSDGEWLYTDIYAPPHAEDADLPAKIAQTISPRLRPDDMLVCQLAVGSHVDHVIVRRAAELLGRPLLYDADVPYLQANPADLAPKSAGMQEKVYTVSEAGLRSWQEAVLAYQSQISSFGPAFDTPEKVRESLQSYWLERKGIRLWERG